MTDKKIVERCEICKFVTKYKDGEIVCRRYPRVFTENSSSWIFKYPLTQRYDWCGEFKPDQSDNFELEEI